MASYAKGQFSFYISLTGLSYDKSSSYGWKSCFLLSMYTHVFRRFLVHIMLLFMYTPGVFDILFELFGMNLCQLLSLRILLVFNRIQDFTLLALGETDTKAASNVEIQNFNQKIDVVHLATLLVGSSCILTW